MARVMKNSGVQWIGEIPSNWAVRRLRTLGSFSASGIDKNIVPGEPLVHIINYVDVYNNKKFVLGQKDYMVVSAPQSKVLEHQVRIGDLIFTPSSETKDDIGVSAVVMEDLPNTAYSYHVLRFRFFDENEVDINYRKYFCNNRFVGQYFSTRSTGTIRQTLSRLDFKDCFVFLPPLDEQHAIAAFLDTKCAEIDGLLADLDAEVKNLAEYKKSIIAETVTKGLNPNAKMKHSGIPWVLDIPEHWKVMANKYVMYKVKEIVPIYGGQDIISLSMNGVVVRDLDAGGKMPTTFNGYQHITPGNLLMCLFDIDVTPRCIGLIKNDGLTSPAYSQFAMRDEAYAPYYYYFYLKMDNTKELVHLSKNMRHSLNEEQFGMIPTIVPPMEEQIAIASYLDEKCKVIDQTIADKNTQMDKLKDYKSSLIYEYVTGKKQIAL